MLDYGFNYELKVQISFALAANQNMSQKELTFILIILKVIYVIIIHLY